MENTTATTTTRYAVIGKSGSPYAHVAEVHIGGTSYTGKNYWVPANWNGDLRRQFVEGHPSLTDTAEQAEAVLAARKARYDAADPYMQAEMDRRGN